MFHLPVATYVEGPSPYEKRGQQKQSNSTKGTFGGCDFKVEIPEDSMQSGCFGLNVELLLQIIEENEKIREANEDDELFKKPKSVPAEPKTYPTGDTSTSIVGPTTSPSRMTKVPPLKIRLPSKRKSNEMAEDIDMTPIHDGSQREIPEAKRHRASEPATDTSKADKIRKTSAIGSVAKDKMTIGKKKPKTAGRSTMIGLTMSEKRVEKLRKMAKKMAANISGKSIHNSTPNDKGKSVNKQPTMMNVAKSSELPKNIKDMFMRASPSGVQKLPQPPPDTADDSGVGDPSREVPSTLAIEHRRKYGQLHRFVITEGRSGAPLRTCPAMLVPLMPPENVISLLNNLTAKVTKAVRQNGGLNFDDHNNSYCATDIAGKFSSRRLYKRFLPPIRYIHDSPMDIEETWTVRKTDVARRSKVAVFDAEMRAVYAGQNYTASNIIATKNAMHTYLFGVRSEYGDTANCESDMLRGQLTKAPIWLKRKPYVENIINGLKYRGQPHITCTLVPMDEQHENMDEYLNDPMTGGLAVDPMMPSINGESGSISAGHYSNLSNADQSACMVSPVTPISAGGSSNSAISPFAQFPPTSACNPFEIDQDLFGGHADQGQFNYNFFTTNRPAPVPPPKPNSTNEYLQSDFATRIY